MNKTPPKHDQADVRGKLSALNFDFGASVYEPVQTEAIPPAALEPSRLRAYLARTYGTSPKFEPHKKNLARILGASDQELESWLSADESEAYKIFTLCATLSAGKAGWAALLSREFAEQTPGVSARRTSASVSDVAAPIPLDTDGGTEDGQPPPDLGDQKALNDGQVRYFFHALASGLGAARRDQYQKLLECGFEHLDGSQAKLVTGMDAVIFRLDEALQRLVRHFHSQDHCFSSLRGRPDAGLEHAISTTNQIVEQLLPNTVPRQTSDPLRVRLIQQASINMARNHVDGILESYRGLGNWLPCVLERFRRFDLLEEQSEVLAEVARAFGVRTSDLPPELLRQAKVVQALYMNNLPAEPSRRSEFIHAHSSAGSMAVCAGLIFESCQQRLEVKRGIRGEHNASTNAYNALRKHEARYRQDREAGKLIYWDLSQADARHWVDRYSIVWQAIGWADVPVREAAHAFIRVKAFKYRLQCKVYGAISKLPFLECVAVVDELSSVANNVVGEVGVSKSITQRRV